MHILSSALTSLHILPNSEFGIFEGMIKDSKVNVLVEQAYGFDVGGCCFHIREKPMQKDEVAASLPEVARPVLETSQTVVYVVCAGSAVELARPDLGGDQANFVGEGSNHFDFVTPQNLEPIWMIGELPLWIV